MKKILFLLALLVSIVFCSTLHTTVHAAPGDIKTSMANASFAFINNDIYYSGSNLNNGIRGIYKVSSNMKTFKTIKLGDYSSIKPYNNTLIAYDGIKEYAVQLSLSGKVIKEFPTISGPNISSLEVYGNHIYFYNYEDESFYQTAIKSGTQKFLIRTDANTLTQEFTIHNGWLYYVHETFDESGYEAIGEHLSKIKLSNPSKEIKLVRNVHNIDSVVVHNGYIYAVIHKTDVLTGRKLYRMNLDGSNLKRVSTQNIGGKPLVSDKYVYFEEFSANWNKKLYRMTLDGKQIKVVAQLSGNPMDIASNKKSMYFEIQNGLQYFLQRVTVK